MAVIRVTPADDITTVINNTASPGDIILAEDGVYNQTVVVTKDNIRVIANGTGAIFNGANMLINGFLLSGTAGVEINGFMIINYVGSGIFIDSGEFNRILRNRVVSSGVNGIELFGTTGNLVWKNETSGNAQSGITAANGSTGNWIIENSASDNAEDGFETLLPIDSGNVFAGNSSTGNQDGYEILGHNLMLDNTANTNESDGAFTLADNLVCVGNKFIANNEDGIQISPRNSILLDNEISNNMSAGVRVLASFHIVEGNEVENNNIGIFIDATGRFNSFIKNKAEGNAVFDIEDNGSDNNFIRNKCCSSSPSGLCAD
jgi:parallel beta-helix repeat protein